MSEFYREPTLKDITIRRINNSLCCILLFVILITGASYFFVIRYSAKLDSLNRQITALNEENADLQNELDSKKSFSNVDMKISQANTLQKASKVIEVNAVQSVVPVEDKSRQSVQFKWAIGY